MSYDSIEIALLSQIRNGIIALLAQNETEISLLTTVVRNSTSNNTNIPLCTSVSIQSSSGVRFTASTNTQPVAAIPNGVTITMTNSSSIPFAIINPAGLTGILTIFPGGVYSLTGLQGTSTSLLLGKGTYCSNQAITTCNDRTLIPFIINSTSDAFSLTSASNLLPVGVVAFPGNYLIDDVTVNITSTPNGLVASTSGPNIQVTAYSSVCGTTLPFGPSIPLCSIIPSPSGSIFVNTPSTFLASSTIYSLSAPLPPFIISIFPDPSQRSILAFSIPVTDVDGRSGFLTILPGGFYALNTPKPVTLSSGAYCSAVIQGFSTTIASCSANLVPIIINGSDDVLILTGFQDNQLRPGAVAVDGDYVGMAGYPPVPFWITISTSVESGTIVHVNVTNSVTVSRFSALCGVGGTVPPIPLK